VPDTYGADATTALCCLLIFLLGGAVVLFAVRRLKRNAPVTESQAPGPADPWAAVPTADLNHQASSRLIEADNALRTSEQELGFAVAQYGPEATTAFASALTAAKAEVAEAFKLRQQLDDAYPEDEPVQRTMLVEIVDRCARADQRLSAEADAFSRLRAMESQVEQLSADLATRRDALRGKLSQTASALTDLQSRYAASAFAAVGDNVEQATARVEIATQELDKAAKSVAGGDRSSAALAVRGAEQALGQADVLLQAVDRLGTDLETANGRVRTLLAEVQAQVAAGKAAQSAAAGAGTADQMNLAAAVARAEQVAIDVRTDIAGAHPDPIGSLARIEAAGTELDQALGGIRDAAERTDRARAMLDLALFTARTAVDSATQFISTRRGAIGSAARTRLMEAQRNLDEASRQADPMAALNAAQRATGLAEQAMDAARADLEQWGGGYGGPVVMGGGMNGAVLGGILLDSMFSGGMSRGRMGGTVIRLGFAQTDPETDQAPSAAPTGNATPGRFGGPSSWGR
jgi:hypothetical protein